MHGHHLRQPLGRPGLTLIEITVGIAIAGVVGLVSAGLFKAGLKSYNYAYVQTRALTSARKALAGDGPNFGMMWAAQNGVSVDSLGISSFTVTPAGDFSTVFSVSNNGLYKLRLATKALQAESVGALTVNYYNIGANGLIMASTAPSAATLVTTLVTTRGALTSARTYNFFSGAQLRNY